MSRLLWIAVGAILLVCATYVDAAEEKVSHTKLVDAQATLREILETDYRTTGSRGSASDEYNLEEELMDMRWLKKDKKGKSKNGRRRKNPAKTPRPVAPTSKGAKAKTPAYVNVRR